MGVSVAGLSAAALIGGISGRSSVASVALSRPLSDEAKARWDSFVHRAQESFLHQAALDAQALDATPHRTGAPSSSSGAPSRWSSGAPS